MKGLHTRYLAARGPAQSLILTVEVRVSRATKQCHNLR